MPLLQPIRMSSLLFKLRRFAIFSIAALLIFVALTQGLVRLLLPVAHDQRQRLENELSTLLKAEVTVGRIDSHWNYFVPYLDLLDVQVKHNADIDEGQRLQRLSVGLNIVDMLRAGSVAPSSLQIEGLTLVLAKKADGSFYLPGLQVPEKSDQPLAIDWESLLSHKGVELSKLRFVLRHEGHDEQLVFDDIALSFNSSGSRYKGELQWLPPEQLGGQAKLNFDLTGDLNRPASWKGDVLVDIPAMQLAALKEYWPVPVQGGHIAFNLALKLNTQGVASSRGDMDLLAIFKDGQKLQWQSPIYADSQLGKLELSSSAPLVLGEQSLNMLEGLGLELDFSEQLGVGLNFSRLDFSRVNELLQALVELPEPWPRRLKAMQPKGVLKDVFAGWDSQHGWNVSAKLEDLSLSAVDKLPGISALNADMLFKQDVLSVQINNQTVNFDSAGLFPEIFELTRLHTTLKVFKDQQEWVVAAPSLFLNTPDIKTHSDFEMRFAKGKKPFLTLHAKAEEGNAANTLKYVPTFLKPATIAWFKQAFISGRVVDADAYIKGYVNELAREGSKAIFRIDAKVENTVFSYAKGWPKVENIDATFHMDNVRMQVDASRAEVLGVRPRYARAVIPNCRKMSVDLHIDAPHSPMPGLLSYVQQSGINKLISGVGSLFEGAGYADISLDLQKNISKAHYQDLKPYFNGHARLQKASLNMPSLDMQIENLHGSVEFSHKHVLSKKIQGTINQQAFTASAKTNATKLGPRAQLDVKTKMSLHDVIKNKSPFLTNKIVGRSTWHGRLEIPLSKGQKSASLSVKGDLQGTEIQFPEPFNKAADTPAAMAAYIALNKTASNRVWLDYQQQLQGVLVFDRSQGGLYSGRLNYRKGKPDLPRGPGLVVDAQLEFLKIDPWINLAEEQGEAVVKNNVLQRVTLQADSLLFKGVAAKQAQATLQQTDDSWNAQVDALGIKGELVLPKDRAKALRVDLDKLDLNTLQFPSGAQQAHADPMQIPSVNLQVGDFTWNDIHLSGLSAELKSVDTGLRIESYRVADPSLNVSGEGLWQSSSDGLQQSLIEFNASTSNMKLGLQKIGIKNLLKQGAGSFSGSLSWKKPPYQLDLSSLSGQLVGEVKKGDLLAVKPGVAKLLGLLNVQSLPKRLALDFKDLSSKGLAFDKAHTKINIEQGIATFESMKIDTDLGEIEIEGRTDLVKQELDQLAKVNPDVSNLIPITAGVVGGLPGLVGALLVDQVVKAFGGDADRVAQVRFKINGSWDDPVVESTRVDRVKDLSEEELRQRAQELVIKAQGVDYEQDVVPGALELSDEEEQSILGEDE